MLWITNQIVLADWELSEAFIRASGPGGQRSEERRVGKECRL